MDIDDILREFDSASAASNSQDYADLTKWWLNERAAPEILEYQEDLIERIMTRVRRQIETIEDQTGNLDPKANFKLIITQTELERVKFLIRSYLRCRISKIDHHALHILSTPTQRTRLSATEQTYLKTHQALLNNLYLSSFLKTFPDQLKRLDDKAGGVNMVEEPDLDSAVFLRVIRDVEVDAPGETSGGGVVEMKVGNVYIIRYRVVRGAVERGDVELI